MQKVFYLIVVRTKNPYVRIVAKKLINNIGEENVILDEITFQQARKSMKKLKRDSNETDLFVLFISETSLESEWVQEEIFKAEDLWNKKRLNLDLSNHN
ncbi:MAG: hypothetical protein ACLTLY_08510 [Agathobacter rectalis]